MPTDKPRISVVLDEETLSEIDDYQFGNRIQSRSKAMNDLLKTGLEINKLKEELGEIAKEVNYDIDHYLDHPKVIELSKKLDEMIISIMKEKWNKEGV